MRVGGGKSLARSLALLLIPRPPSIGREESAAVAASLAVAWADSRPAARRSTVGGRANRRLSAELSIEAELRAGAGGNE